MNHDTAIDRQSSQDLQHSAPPCTCGRSATGFCTGLHRLTNEEWDHMFVDHVVQQKHQIPQPGAT